MKKHISSICLHSTVDRFGTGYISLYGGPSRSPHECIGRFKVHHGSKGDYIWYNHSTYYL